MSGPSDLVRLVAGHTRAGDEASISLAKHLIERSAVPWRRSDFEPGHFTASAFVLSPDRDAVLLIHHGKLGRWLQPGGHFEPTDESVVAAAAREVAEETGVCGLRPTGVGLVRIDAHPIPAHGAEPPHVHIDLGVGFISSSREIGALAEVTDARWVRFQDLGDLGCDRAVHDGVRAVRAAVG